jgi:hypothetical protein
VISLQPWAAAHFPSVLSSGRFFPSVLSSGGLWQVFGVALHEVPRFPGLAPPSGRLFPPPMELTSTNIMPPGEQSTARRKSALKLGNFVPLDAQEREHHAAQRADGEESTARHRPRPNPHHPA